MDNAKLQNLKHGREDKQVKRKDSKFQNGRKEISGEKKEKEWQINSDIWSMVHVKAKKVNIAKKAKIWLRKNINEKADKWK